MNREIAAAAFETDYGWCAAAVAGGQVICVILPGDRKAALAEIGKLGRWIASPDDDPLLREVSEGIRAYLAGERFDLDYPVDLSCETLADASRGAYRVSSGFDRKIWRATRLIPRGSVETYGGLAKAAGYPGAARAVGNAMAKNPLPLIVPCHRVVRSGGVIGGFGGGSDMKRRLLELEGAMS